MINVLVKFKDTIAKALLDLEVGENKDNTVVTTEAIRILHNKKQEAKVVFHHCNDLNMDNEIFYTKNIRCYISSKIYFYKKLHKIEINKPPLKIKNLKLYYFKKLNKVKKKLAKYNTYQRYYLSNESELDKFFFIRVQKVFSYEGKTITKKLINRFFLKLYTEIIGLNMLRTELKSKIINLNNETNPQGNKLHWTSSKTDFTELIYALHASGVFNNGKVSIKEIVETFQNVFNIDISQQNRIFYDIKLRKRFKTKYLDQLKVLLLKKINEADFELFTE